MRDVPSVVAASNSCLNLICRAGVRNAVVMGVV